jgi:glutamine amidotransferase
VIAIVDYGRGNLGSVERLFGRVGVPAVVTQEPRVIDEADAVVFPGDGAFHDSMANLAGLGLMEPVRRALDGRRPFLGICIGYQLLFSTSEEFGEGRGLDVIPGVVRRFPPALDVPHMGWNRVWHGGALRLFDGIEDGARFYFVHSYFPVLDPLSGGSEPHASRVRPPAARAGLASPARTPERRGSDTPDDGPGTPDHGPDAPGYGLAGLALAWCDYGVRFAAALETGRIYGTQFHPEKSHRAGIRLLENFAAIVKENR